MNARQFVCHFYARVADGRAAPELVAKVGAFVKSLGDTVKTI